MFPQQINHMLIKEISSYSFLMIWFFFIIIFYRMKLCHSVKQMLTEYYGKVTKWQSYAIQSLSSYLSLALMAELQSVFYCLKHLLWHPPVVWFIIYPSQQTFPRILKKLHIIVMIIQLLKHSLLLCLHISMFLKNLPKTYTILYKLK